MSEQGQGAQDVTIANEAEQRGGSAVVVKSANDAAGNRVVLQWRREGVGFGELVFYENEDGELGVDEEHMSGGFCLDVLRQALASPPPPPEGETLAATIAEVVSPPLPSQAPQEIEGVCGNWTPLKAGMPAPFSPTPAPSRSPEVGEVKSTNPCSVCGTWLWNDTRPCWSCAREAGASKPQPSAVEQTIAEVVDVPRYAISGRWNTYSAVGAAGGEWVRWTDLQQKADHVIARLTPQTK